MSNFTSVSSNLCGTKSSSVKVRIRESLAKRPRETGPRLWDQPRWCWLCCCLCDVGDVSGFRGQHSAMETLGWGPSPRPHPPPLKATFHFRIKLVETSISCSITRGLWSVAPPIPPRAAFCSIAEKRANSARSGPVLSNWVDQLQMCRWPC